jgi:acyl-CoA-binding protein
MASPLVPELESGRGDPPRAGKIARKQGDAERQRRRCNAANAVSVATAPTGRQRLPRTAFALTAYRARAITTLPFVPAAERPMSDLKAQFEKAAEDIKKLAERPDNDTLLKLYALYKQGAEGDVNGPKPGFFDFVGTAKYEAWAKLKGTSQDDAQKKYVALVKKLTG